jgi:hypothetical protein
LLEFLRDGRHGGSKNNPAVAPSWLQSINGTSFLATIRKAPLAIKDIGSKSFTKS